MEFRLLVIFIVVEIKSRKINNFYHPQVGGGGIVRDPLVHKEVTIHCFAFELVPTIMS